LGTLYHGKKVGGIGDVGCISFHGAKIAVGGEGGMFLTNNKEYYERAKLLSNMGRTDRLGTFWCDELGYEYQMANVTAALIRAQVERIENLVAMKRRIYSWYFDRLCDSKKLYLLREPVGCRSNFAYPAALLNTNKINRDLLVEKLSTYNIHARCAFPQMSKFPMYTQKYKNPNAAIVSEFGFNLPSALDMTEKDVDYVCKILKSLV
jgi:perosamine synthetase